MTLAIEGVFFEFALQSQKYGNGFVYQFMRTRFIYEVDESDESIEVDELVEEEEDSDELVEEDELDEEDEEDESNK